MYPRRHSHVKLPFVLRHNELMSQLAIPSLHSLTSEDTTGRLEGSVQGKCVYLIIYTNNTNVILLIFQQMLTTGIVRLNAGLM